MKVFLTNFPSFYKIKLFNAINEKQKIVVIFSGTKNFKNRNNDFFSGDIHFEHYFFTDKDKCKRIKKFLKAHPYEELIIAGWDSKENWYSALHFSKSKNAMILESTIYESKTKGVKAFAKRIFLSRMNKVYASGQLHKELLKALGFKKEIIMTGGVGLMNRISQPAFEYRSSVKNFLYVGRLVEVKNLRLLIETFNEMPELNLTIIGFGILENELKAIAKENVIFTGAIDNSELSKWYQKSDVFILPSKSEPWGLVVEEALNNGTPILLSNRVGCAPELLTETTGLEFRYDSKEELKKAVHKICDIELYNRLRLGVSKLDFEKRENEQINAYF